MTMRAFIKELERPSSPTASASKSMTSPQFLDGNSTEGIRNLLGLPPLPKTENVARNDRPSAIVELLKSKPNKPDRDNPY
jgi:hypothetical protein